jgi:hypothetical protein
VTVDTACFDSVIDGASLWSALLHFNRTMPLKAGVISDVFADLRASDRPAGATGP